MKKNICILILLIISLYSFGGKPTFRNCLFGDHIKHVKTLENGVYRIFADMNGDFYPENIIEESELRNKGKSQLCIWAKEFPNKFKDIAESYHLINTDYSERNYLILQDSIKNSIAKTINKNSSNRQTWIIHGFRKRLYRKENDSKDNKTSVEDNAIGVSKINNYLDKKELIIELYWDGRYGKTFTLRQKVKMGNVFKKEAIPTAQKIGYSLRDIFSKIKCPNINLISHSTGTHVVCNLLFNVNKNYTSPTPHQNIKVALLASASPGKKLFKNYYERNSTIDFNKNDNYKILNVYHIDDFVLLKQKQKSFVKGSIKIYGPKFSSFLGNTRLGCNRFNEAFKLKKYFERKFPHSYFEYSRLKDKGRTHLFSSYMDSKRLYSFLFDEG